MITSDESGGKIIMQKNMVKKVLVVGIILLFFGASVVPVISGDIRKSNDLNNDETQYVFGDFLFTQKNIDDNEYLHKKEFYETSIFLGDPHDEEWNRTFGGTDFDEAWTVQQTNDNGYIIAGNTFSYGSGGSVWLIKTDENGSKQWDKIFGGTGIEKGRSVQQVDDGYIITGTTSSYGSGGYDFWLIKTDENGSKQWDKTFGGNAFDNAYSVQQTIDGGYIIAGETRSFGVGNNDVWLIKTDEYGNEQWNKTYGGNEIDASFSVQQTNDGGFIVTGYTESYGISYGDVWLIKTDEYGNEQWNKTYGGTNSDGAKAVHQTTDYGYIIIGSTSSYGGSYSDVWLIKTDEFGNEQWNKTYGELEVAGGSDVQQTYDGGYIITGVTEHHNAYNSNVWIIKTDANGIMQWNKILGGVGDEEGHSIQQTVDGGYIRAGKTRSYGNGGFDVWLIKISGETFNNAFFIGFIDDYCEEEGFSVFKAKFVLFMTINPFSINCYSSYEAIVISNDYNGYIGQKFIIGRFNAAVFAGKQGVINNKSS